MIHKNFHKHISKLFIYIISLTIILAGILCLYDLYNSYKKLQIFNKITIIQSVYFLFVISLWIIWWFSLYYGILALNIYIESRYLIGTMPSKIRNTMTLLSTISRTGQFFIFSKYLLFWLDIIGILIFFVFNNWRLLFILQLGIMLHVWLWIRTSTIPMVILLSSSHPKCLTRHWAYKRLVSPLRVVTLLDFNQITATKIETELRLDCLRASNDNDWWHDIGILLNLSPIIIIDTSIISEGTLREAEYIFLQSLTFKTLFLMGVENEHPLLDKISVGRLLDIKTLCLMNEDSAMKLVSMMIEQSIFPTGKLSVTSLLSMNNKNNSSQSEGNK